MLAGMIGELCNMSGFARAPDWLNSQLGAVLSAVVLTIVFKWSKEVGSFVLFIDSIGLGVSTVAGTALALDLNLDPIPAILLGLLSAVLGGLTRDLLAQVPPVLLHRETNGTASSSVLLAFM